MSNYNTKLPNKVILDQRLTYTAKKVCAAIYALHNVKYTVSVKYLCIKSGLSDETVYAALTALEQFGYIKRLKNFEYNKTLRRVVWGRNSYICMLPTKTAFTFIPGSVFRKSMTPGSFVLLLYIRYIAGNKSRAYPSYSVIHRSIGMSKSWIRECIAFLGKINLIHVEHCLKQNGAFACNSYFILAISESMIMKAQAPSLCFNDTTTWLK